MSMQVWVGNTFNGSCRFVHELSPHKIPDPSIKVAIFFSYPRFGFLFDFLHGFSANGQTAAGAACPLPEATKNGLKRKT